MCLMLLAQMKKSVRFGPISSKDKIILQCTTAIMINIMSSVTA